jgi:LmbE family N-acetylglucosaminyl deacetylase
LINPPKKDNFDARTEPGICLVCSKHMKKIFLLLLTAVTLNGTRAQLNQSLNSSEILQAMHKLNTLGSVLYVAAHPDDENTRLLAYLANEKKFRTAYLSITRGDGGQNLIGKEQGEMLGLVRTQELLAARRTDGAEQFFTRANDFGYSKNPEETFSIWNKDSIMADVVFAIRKFRPDVIICRFPTTGEGGHGHHTASAMLAVEAFDLAADPSKFPEQLQYVQVWQAKRLFWNTFNFGGTNTTSPDQLKIDAGAYNPLLGKNYGEIASESRSMHKSQGFGSARQRGENIEYFKFLKGEKAETDIFEGVSSSWDKLPAGIAIGKLLEQCVNGFQPASPEKSLPLLVEIYKQVSAMDEKDANAAYWKKIKLKETERLILACSGLWLETFASDYIAIPGQDMNLTTQVVNRNRNQVRLSSISYWKQTDTSLSLDLRANELYTFKHREKLQANTPFSNPYWLNAKHPAGLYRVDNPLLIGQPQNDPLTKVFFKVNIAGLEMEIERPVVYKNTDPVKGEVYRPLEILPPATVNIPEKVFVFTDIMPRLVQLKVKANMPVSGMLQIQAGQGWSVELKKPQFTLANKGDEILIDVILTPGKNAGNGTLKVSLLIDGNVFGKSIQRIEYDHIPYQFFLTDAEAGLVHVELKKTILDIGYIPGAGDDVPAALKQVGYNVTILTDELLASSDLSKYKAIVTGVRAYNTNERLQLMHAKLMEYVKKGGNLVVQYNTNSRVGPLQAKIGPYPFTISRDRVTNEQAEVRFRNAAHPVLNTPNKISSVDFEGWIQERGIYFATEVDSQYTSIFSINDPGEKASDGSLIIAAYGKGNFIYTGLAFFRELPAGVPGAYRLFVNILSLPPHASSHE